MKIRFRQQPMALDVMASILAASRMTRTQTQSMVLDKALQQPPTEPMAAPEGIEDAIVGKALDL